MNFTTQQEFPRGKYFDFIKELSSLINKYSLEKESATPDYLIAEYLVGCLQSYEMTCKRNKIWHRDTAEVEAYVPGKSFNPPMPGGICE